MRCLNGYYHQQFQWKTNLRADNLADQKHDHHRSTAPRRRITLYALAGKRAYEDLERDGFIETVAGKGSFVAAKNMELIREEHLRLVESYLQQAVQAAKTCGVSREELCQILDLLYGEEP